MLDFPNLGNVEEPRQKKMSLEEYNRFCDFCLRNNPRATAEHRLRRTTGEEQIKEPFRL